MKNKFLVVFVLSLAWKTMAAEPDLFYPPAGRPQPPSTLVQCLVVKDIEYFDHQGILRKGKIVTNKDLANDLVAIFNAIKVRNKKLLVQQQFPITSIIPVSDPRFNWSDDLSMNADNTSSYNYRLKTGGSGLSLHAVGRAVDVNTFCNPYIKNTGTGNPPIIEPKGAQYNPHDPCAISRATPNGKFIINAFLSRGWKWGGDWTNPKDYQHFEKPDINGQNPVAPFCK